MGGRSSIPNTTRIVRDIQSSLRRQPSFYRSNMIDHVLPYVSYLNDGNWKLELSSPPLPYENQYC